MTKGEGEMIGTAAAQKERHTWPSNSFDIASGAESVRDGVLVRARPERGGIMSPYLSQFSCAK